MSSSSPAKDLNVPKDLPEDGGLSYRPDDALANRPIRAAAEEALATMSFNQMKVEGAGTERSSQADAPPKAVVAAATAASQPPAYSLRRMIGEGGFGEVWEARQNSLTRTVAIKRLREDLLESSQADEKKTKAFRQSFCEEALTAAHLDHPNIVPVYDLGVDAQGRPLLAMKLVKGTPWNKMIEADFGKMAPDDFLAKHIPVLLDVAQAVAFAHSRGIVHRDLKPAQVMVGEYGEVLLMDWGLAVVYNAEALKQHDDAASLEIAPTPENALNPAGTPAFMAPEQTESTAKNIGPWTDVYLLGGMLYQMLTGRTPRKGGNTAQLFMQAAQGVYTPIREAAPDRPMPGELVALVGDAMMPRIIDRVPSAQGFVYRVQQYLSGANNREESFKITVEVKKKLKSAAGDYRVYGDCIALLNRALTLWPGNPDGAALQEQALTEFCRSATKHGDFVLAKVQAERKEDKAEQAVLLKEIKKAEYAAGRAKRMRRFLLYVIFLLLALMGLGAGWYAVDVARKNQEVEAARQTAEKKKAEAESQFRRAAAARGDAEALIDFMLRDLARQLEPVGRLDVLNEVAKRAMGYFQALPVTDKGAKSALRETVAMRQIGQILEAQGDLAGAQSRYSTARNKLMSLRSQNPRDPEIVAALGDAYRLLGQLALKQGNNNEALKQYSEFRDTMKVLLEDEPDNTALAHQHALSLLAIADVYRNLLRFDDATANLSEATGILAGIATANASVLEWQRDRARGLNMLGSLLQQRGDLAGAEANYEAAKALLEEIIAKDPQNKTFREELARSLVTLGDLQEARGQLGEALARFEEYQLVMLELAELDPANKDWERALATGLRNQADIALARGEYEKARGLATEAVDKLNELISLDGRNASWRRERAQARMTLATLDALEGKHAEALAIRREIHRELQLLLFGTNDPLQPGDRNNVSLQGDYALNWIGLAEALYDTGEFNRAEEDMAEARKVARNIFQTDPSNTVSRRTLGRAFLLNARTRDSFGEVGPAREAREQAVEVLAPLVTLGSRWDDLRLYALALLSLGRVEDARPIVARLREQGFKDPGFDAQATAAGL